MSKTFEELRALCANCAALICTPVGITAGDVLALIKEIESLRSIIRQCIEQQKDYETAIQESQP